MWQQNCHFCWSTVWIYDKNEQTSMAQMYSLKHRYLLWQTWTFFLKPLHWLWLSESTVYVCESKNKSGGQKDGELETDRKKKNIIKALCPWVTWTCFIYCPLEAELVSELFAPQSGSVWAEGLIHTARGYSPSGHWSHAHTHMHTMI